jgi:heat shock protein HslJ
MKAKRIDMMRALCMLLLALSTWATAAAAGSVRLGAGSEWRVLDVNGYPVDPARPLTLRLEAEGRASGSAGCNSFSGSWAKRSRERIRFGPLVTTKMGCDAATMEQEQRYLAILAAVQGYSLYGDGSVSLIAADGRAVRFRRK